MDDTGGPLADLVAEEGVFFRIVAYKAAQISDVGGDLETNMVEASKVCLAIRKLVADISNQTSRSYC